MLAGMVENPSLDNPVTNPAAAIKRRNVVLARMAQLKIISQARAVAVGKQGLGLHLSPLQTGCTSGSAKPAAFFCDYVVSLLKQDNAFSQAWNVLNTSGGLQIYTTLSAQDERAAKLAVNYMVPQPPNGANPGGNAVSEVLIQPGSGHILAIANDRSYGTGKNQTTEDYAVNSQYDGGVGVQTGSSSKLFTLVTALAQGVPFGFPQTVPAATTLTGFTNCKGQPTGALARDQRLTLGKGRVQPVQRDRPVGQHLLRHAGAQGRPVQRGQDGRRAGRDPGRRQVTAEVGPRPAARR